MTFLEENLEVILITYNRKSKLEQTLTKCFSETSPIKNIKFTILDNCSNDRTFELCNTFKEKYTNINYIKHRVNIGGDANFCRALEYTTKKYVWFLCDDDEIIWDKWNYIEDVLKTNKYDAIFVRNCLNTLADIFKESTFIPSAIYKTTNITTDVIFNAYDNIRNKLPQLSIIANIINNSGEIFVPDFNIIKTAPNGIVESYSRGVGRENLPETKANFLWGIGYLNSIELVHNKKAQAQIIQGISHRNRHLYHNLYSFLYYTLALNYLACNDYKFNKYQLKRNLNFKQKITFYKANMYINLRKIFINKNLYKNNSTEVDWQKYLESVNTQKHINKLCKKYKNKRILLYGAGKIFETIKSQYDLSKLNIVGICDGKFKESTSFQGYNTIPLSEISKQDIDIIIFTLYRQDEVKDSLIKQGITAKFDSLIKNTKKIFKNI